MAKRSAGGISSVDSAAAAERPTTSTKPTERSHEENQERAYIAASRRSDRSLEARIKSALMASEIHKKRTGKGFKITEGIVAREEMYEEEEDDLPRRYYAFAAPLSGANNALSPSMAKQAAIANLARHQDIDRLFAEQFPHAAQMARSRMLHGQGSPHISQFPNHHYGLDRIPSVPDAPSFSQVPSYPDPTSSYKSFDAPLTLDSSGPIFPVAAPNSPSSTNISKTIPTPMSGYSDDNNDRAAKRRRGSIMSMDASPNTTSTTLTPTSVDSGSTTRTTITSSPASEREIFGEVVTGSQRAGGLSTAGLVDSPSSLPYFPSDAQQLGSTKQDGPSPYFSSANLSLGLTDIRAYNGGSLGDGTLSGSGSGSGDNTPNHMSSGDWDKWITHD